MKLIILTVVLALSSLSVWAILPPAQKQSPARGCFRSQTDDSIIFGDMSQQVRICGNDSFAYVLNINGRDKEFEARSCVSIVASKINVSNGDVLACVSTSLYPAIE